MTGVSSKVNIGSTAAGGRVPCLAKSAQVGFFHHVSKGKSSVQCSKPLLLDDYRGLYYPVYWGFGDYKNPIGESLYPNQYNGIMNNGGILNTAHL